MKKTLLLFAALASLVGCSDDDNKTAAVPATQNKVLLLKVDYTTNAFEGGKELVFPDAEGFTIGKVYHSPGDFGDITLNYAEVNQPIFAGTIHWMGEGARTFPQNMEGTNTFPVMENPMAMPALTQFEKVDYGNESAYPENIDYQGIWAAIDNIAAVKEFRESNPSAKISLFLYTPAVGVVDEEKADWYVLKN